MTMAPLMKAYKFALPPMLAQCATAGFLFSAGDIIAQQAVEGKGKDYQKMLRGVEGKELKQEATKQVREQVVKIAMQNWRKPFKNIGKEVEPQLSAETVHEVLAEKGYHCHVAWKVPLLSGLARKKCLNWAMDYWSMTFEQWGDIAWSDEVYIMLGESPGQIFVTCHTGEAFDNECCIPCFKQSSVRCMVWSLIIRGMKGPLVILEYLRGKGGGMTAEWYQEQVLEGALDGAPSHCAKTTTEWFNKHHIPLFLHPPSSPDLSPIEPVWHIFKSKLHDCKRQPTMYNELCAAIFEVWDDIDYDDIDKFIDHMPEVVQAMIDAKGGHTQY
ncbi:transposable element tc1 [Moniliophthora roreri MCA 2997]|uniref:Transposable element tc1 n=1 Tax=Moniliophthora roreri (strain MCA 2997) TaxID=1381753 RepID=V2YJK6_MONRO|nr:transposable element tc1 [Moniliophthora roreri MCA 2997]